VRYAGRADQGGGQEGVQVATTLPGRQAKAFGCFWLVPTHPGQLADAEGAFQIAAVPVGEYSVTVALQGFKTARQTVTVISDRHPENARRERDRQPLLQHREQSDALFGLAAGVDDGFFNEFLEAGFAECLSCGPPVQ
jgi:hypothetical protein